MGGQGKGPAGGRQSLQHDNGHGRDTEEVLSVCHSYQDQVPRACKPDEVCQTSNKILSQTCLSQVTRRIVRSQKGQEASTWASGLPGCSMGPVWDFMAASLSLPGFGYLEDNLQDKNRVLVQ